MTFSQRNNYLPKPEIQFETLNLSTRIKIYNFFILAIFDNINKYKYTNRIPFLSKEFEHFINVIWIKYLNNPIDNRPDKTFQVKELINDIILKDTWYCVLDFLEIILNSNIFKVDKSQLITMINDILQSENSAYRFFDDKFVPLSNNEEIESITNSLEVNYKNAIYKDHIKKSLVFLSYKPTPDYSNSIKEAISAVESICKSITGDKDFGKALLNLEKKGVKINSQYLEGMKQFYGYTNNKESGIRHAAVDMLVSPDYYDAKSFLVICTVFINYLIGKNSLINVENIKNQ